MTKRFKTIAALSFLSLTFVTAAVAITQGNNLINFVSADDTGITLSGTNGAVQVASLKTTTSNSKTALGSDVKVIYKNAELSSGNVGVIKKGGYYGNYDPIWGMGKITVASSASAGDAKIIYGKTSNCIDGEVDLASGVVDGSNANYFRIVANKDVTIKSVTISFTCDNTENGFTALNGETDVSNLYTFESNGEGYNFKLIDAKTSHTVTKLVVPDYYGTGSAYAPVTKVMNTGSYGIFEKASGLKEVYFPETTKEFGSYFFGTSGVTLNDLQTYTFPRDLETASNYGSLLPTSTGLTTVYYNSKNLTYNPSSASGFNSTKQPNLRDLYVSYDVESLPNKLVVSFPADMVLHYEGTEAEWASLVASASNWGKATNVICSDTVVANVTFVHPNAVLKGNTGSTVIDAIIGKQIVSPGTPVWQGEGNKVFNGWYTEAEGGTKVSFPYTVSGDVTLYAQFIDMPVGYSVSDPLTIVKGSYEVVTNESFGSAKYFKYTASTAESVYFEATDVVADSISSQIKVFNVDGTEATMSSSTSYSALESTKKIANLVNKTNFNNATVKINFEAGESYIIGYSVYNFVDGKYGTATLNVFGADECYGDYSVAKPYALGTNATIEDLPSNIPTWHSFTAAETGTHTVEFNNAGDKNCSNSLGYFVDGVYKELASSNYSVQTKYVELTAGTTYYVVNTGNGTAGTYGFRVYYGTPDGYSTSNAISLTVDGGAVQNINKGFYYNYYKFEIANAGWYKIVSDVNIYSQESVSYTETSSYQYVQISQNEDLSSLISGARYLTDTSSKEAYFEFAVGTYYMKATVLSSTTTLAIESVSNAEGLTVNSAKEITLASGTPIDTADAATSGKLYKFTVTSSDYHVFTADSSATVKIGTKSNSSLLSSYSSTLTMSKGEMHKKLTVGSTYYLYVENATVVNFETAETIEDGTSAETAYTYVLGTEEKTVSNGGRVKSSLTYFKLSVPESGDYVVTRGSSSSYYFKLKENDTTLSTTSTSGTKAFYSLETGKQYTIEAYSYGFSIAKAQPGYAKTAAIDIEITGETTSIDLSCTFRADGTWYKFTSQSAGWYEFVTTSSVTLEVYLNTSTSVACKASTKAGDVKLAIGDIVYLCVKGTLGSTGTFTISHPESVQNGLSAETALSYTKVDGQNYMAVELTQTVDTDSSGFFWLKATVEPNTDYVYYSVGESGDFDLGGIYASDGSTTISTSIKNNDVSSTETESWNGTSFVVSEKTCSTNSSDFFACFNSGDNTTIYLKTKLYSSGLNTTNLYLEKANDFVGTTGDSGEGEITPTECTFNFALIGSNGDWHDSTNDIQIRANETNKTITFYVWDNEYYDYVQWDTFTYVSESENVYTFSHGSSTITITFNSETELTISGSTVYAGTYTNS